MAAESHTEAAVVRPLTTLPSPPLNGGWGEESGVATECVSVLAILHHICQPFTLIWIVLGGFRLLPDQPRTQEAHAAAGGESVKLTVRYTVDG